MALYVDGYVLPVPKKKLQAYRHMAQKAGRVWREHGALDFKECAGDDLKKTPWTIPFTKVIKLKPGETVVFSFIVFKSRQHRDRVNAKVMKDSRITGMDMSAAPFDCKRMVYGGFKVIVDA
jgi:uncharacterized protein YbaA (DUF1428 family)